MDAMFDLRRLRLLHELSLRGTLAAVADALSFSPSTVSQQLAQLEKEAGVALLVADGRRVRLTEHGHALAAHAERALALDEQIRGELETLGPTLAPVRIAVPFTVAQAIVPRALARVAERLPHLRVELAELPPEEGLFELSTRGFDLVVAEQYPGHTRAPRAGILRTTLGTDALRIAVPPASDARSLADLADLPWVLEPRGTAAREWAVQQCRAAGFEPDVRHEYADLTAQTHLISAGLAVGILPDLLWARAQPPVRLINLPGEPSRELFTAVRSASSERIGIRAVQVAFETAFAEV